MIYADKINRTIVTVRKLPSECAGKSNFYYLPNHSPVIFQSGPFLLRASNVSVGDE